MLLFSFSCGYKHVNENSTTAGPMKTVIGCRGSLTHLHTHQRSFGKVRKTPLICIDTDRPTASKWRRMVRKCR